jgi:hypothetical protein
VSRISGVNLSELGLSVIGTRRIDGCICYRRKLFVAGIRYLSSALGAGAGHRYPEDTPRKTGWKQQVKCA